MPPRPAAFPGDGAGFPVVINASGSYRLTSNLSVPDANTSGVVVFAASVDLNLAGFTIGGVTTCAGVPTSSCAPAGPGVGIDAASDVRVHDGAVAHMGSHGVRLGYSARVENLHVFHNAKDGIRVGTPAYVRGCEVVSNGEHGIYAESEARIIDNVVVGSGLAGVRAQGGLATGNSSTRNGGVGGEFAAPLSFSGNVFAGNTGGSVVGGTALLGNSCDDGKCERVESRRYYQTQGAFDGAHALSACATGFHMASLDELHFARGLRYDQTLGLYFPNLYDQGRGLLAHGAFTWIRTSIRSSDAPVAGEANCQLWTSTSGYGTNIRWQANLTSPATQASPFVADVQSCQAFEYVMCIED